jgi:hypothetical protein
LQPKGHRTVERAAVAIFLAMIAVLVGATLVVNHWSQYDSRAETEQDQRATTDCEGR